VAQAVEYMQNPEFKPHSYPPKMKVKKNFFKEKLHTTQNPRGLLPAD
jgi:hypothetical protein